MVSNRVSLKPGELLDSLWDMATFREHVKRFLPKKCRRCKKDQIQLKHYTARFVYYRCRICDTHDYEQIGPYDEQAARRAASPLHNEITERLVRGQVVQDTRQPVSRSRHT